jgi:hypothetical protein
MMASIVLLLVLAKACGASREIHNV